MGAQSIDQNGQNFDENADESESPVHQVALSDYYIGKYEVTQALWQAVMGTNPSHFQGELLPVENVGPNSIKDFLHTLNARLSSETNGLQFKLPTEAQWEFAAKGGKESQGYKYSGSNNSSAVAWYSGNSGQQTHPIGSKEPNELFLYDMSGNVFEWCNDYAGSYVGVSQTDPIGPSQEFMGNDPGWIIRGGSWRVDADYCRSSARDAWNKGESFIGFRLALSGNEGQATVPGPRTGNVSDITTNSAHVTGSLWTDGGSYQTEWGFCYGISPDLVANGTLNPVSEYGQNHDFSGSLTNLQAGTKYYVCAYAKNAVGTGYGEVVEFTTLDNIRITTSPIINITDFTAVGGGNVISDGGSTVTERGICWSTTSSPTIEDNHISNGSGLGSYTVNIMGLLPENTYIVRAYAINSLGIAYGNEISFTTLSNNGNAPSGAINGKFTINENGVKVYFSQGNLQYQASTDNWRFAENQWDYIGSGNSNASPTYSGWIDRFGWGTSGWNNGNIYYHPYDHQYVSQNGYNIGYGYGPTDGTNYTYDLTGEYANADWGVYNKISNGDNMAGIWRTLTFDELRYVINLRTTSSGIRFAKARVCGNNGLIILPDNWDIGVYTLNNTNDGDSYFENNIISSFNWNKMETNGAVFLPAATSATLEYGEYWTSSALGTSSGKILYFSDGLYGLMVGNGQHVCRYDGNLVRLVRIAE